MWMNCVLWLATGAQLFLGVPGEPVRIYGNPGTFRIDFEDGTKSMGWADGEWTRWECEHYVEPELLPTINEAKHGCAWGIEQCRGGE